VAAIIDSNVDIDKIISDDFNVKKGERSLVKT